MKTRNIQLNFRALDSGGATIGDKYLTSSYFFLISVYLSCIYVYLAIFTLCFYPFLYFEGKLHDVLRYKPGN